MKLAQRTFRSPQGEFVDRRDLEALRALIRAALPPSLASVPDAATAFKVSVPTMRRWVKAGAVPTVKVGATIRVDLSRLHGTDDLSIARATLTRGASRG